MVRKTALKENLGIVGMERNEVEIMPKELNRIEVMRRKKALIMGISVLDIRVGQWYNMDKRRRLQL